jgi:tetratricopeptide (TPR) repeat protein
MKHARAWPTLLAVCACAGAWAGEARIGKFTEYDAGEFTIVTSRSASQARQFMQDLAKFRLTLERTLGKRATQNSFPTRILITSASDWNRYLMPRQGVAGFFHSSHFANNMAMNGDADRLQATHVIFHEYTHYYLASHFAGEYPPWFNEGLAELMGFAKFTDKNMAILQIPMYQVYEARDGDWIKFERLIRVDQRSPEYQKHELADAFYAQAWLTVHYGLVENKDFGKKIFVYLSELNTLHPHEEAARKAFGADLAAVDQQLRAYARSNNLRSGAIALGDMPPFTLSVGKPLSEAEAYSIFIDTMLDARYPPEHILPMIDALAKREPASARVAIFRARAAALADDAAAYDRAVAEAEATLPAEDFRSRRDLALVLLQNSSDYSPFSKRKTEDSERDLQRAYKWFGEAIAHSNDDVEALWGYGTAATRLDRDLELAATALQTAYKRAPASADIAVSLANLEARRKNFDAMVPFLKDAIRFASDLGTRQWAAETLAQMQKWIVERDAIDAQNKKQREDYEKSLAEYEKKYGKPKKKKTGG